jgi:nitroreductase
LIRISPSAEHNKIYHLRHDPIVPTNEVNKTVNVKEIDAAATRQQADSPEIDPMFLSRWSPRALSGQSLTQADVEALVEAARWAPSCFNAQPWRFAYALAGSEGFAKLFGTLVEGNQAWASKAGALIAVVTRSRYEHNDKPAPTHCFDGGAAWMSLALQAQSMGLVAHGMQGFDAAAAREVLSLPDVFELPALIAVGHPGELDDLPEDYREREKPSDRKPLDELLFENNFSGLDG